MQELHVPAATFVTSGIAALAGVLIPLSLFIFLRKKYDIKKIPYFVGFAVFIIFAMTLEGIFNRLILGGGRAEILMQRPLLYGLAGGFLAGLFEETGRFVAFKTILKKYRTDDLTAISYGAGHGGFEVFFVLFSASVSNIIIATMINMGNIDALTANLDEAGRASVEQTLVALCDTNPLSYLLSIVERIAALTFHLSASVLVWFAVKNKRHWIFYPLAIMLHTIFNAIAASASMLGIHVALVELIICVMAVLYALLARYIWKKERIFLKESKDL